MIGLLRYLKKYTIPIILAVGLLFIQANMDLALPDYMSKIVNTGIQQGGVSGVFPDVMTKDMTEKLVLFLDSGSVETFNKLYTAPDSSKLDMYTKKYPAIAENQLLLLDKSVKTDAALETEISKAFLAVDFLEAAVKDPAKAKMMGPQFDLSKLPAGSDIFKLLGSLPAAQRSAMSEQIDSQFKEMDPKIINQAAIGIVYNFYASTGLDMDALQINYIVQTGLLMLGLTLISVICTIMVGLIAARTAAGSALMIRRDLFRKVESFSLAEFDKFSTASLITRSTNDITQVQTVVFLIIRMVIYAPIMGIGGFFRALSKAPSMGWIIGLAVLFMLCLIVLVVLIAMPKFVGIQKLVDRLNLVARENLSGLMVVRAFNRQGFEEKRFDEANKDLTKTNLFVMRVMVIMMPLIMLVMNVLSVSIIWLGSHQVAEGSMQVGDMMAFLQYAMQIVMSFMMLSMVFIFLPRASVSGKRINEVLKTQPSVNDPVNPKHFESEVSGKIEFKNVDFRYPGGEENALENLNFTAEPGKTTAIIGATGSGKSTLVNLIPRFYDVTQGQILIDGIDLRDLAQEELRSKIGFVPQKNILFSGTIATNLLYADKTADNDAMEEAAKIAQATEFIETNEEKLDYAIAQSGSNVSGGQKQRLSIARALMRKAPIYIFDDSFSALDFKTDSALRKAMKDKTQKSTLLIIAQRLSTIMNADKILVLDNGKITGMGTHQELMKTCQEYREIAQSQLGLKEDL